MDPLLIEVPERIETENLVLRSPRRGDGAIVNAAVMPRSRSSVRGCPGPVRA